MLFTLEVLKAHEGDCMLLHWGTGDDPKLAVIDGGPTDTYQSVLRPRLDQIRDNRGLDQLEIEFVMVSHVDNDHIVGVKQLFSALYGEVQANTPEAAREIRVRRLWHNAFDDIVNNALNAHYGQFEASFTADASGALPPASEGRIKAELEDQGEEPDEAAHLANDITKVLAAHPEARDLRDKHRYLYQQHAIARLNAPFTNQGGATLITASLTPEPVSVGGLFFHVVGPMDAEIAALQAKFDEYLQLNRLNTAEAALAAYSDPSVPNLSSIVCMARMGEGEAARTILFTGDARGDKMIAGLRGAGYLDGGADEHMHVNVLKVPHHGSDRNVRPDFFRKITADVYVLSGDGKDGNPDRATLEWLIESRAPDDQFRIVMTYDVAETDLRREDQARSPWNDEEDSLQALIDAKRTEGYHFTLDAGAPISIDLGDEQIGW
jgi:beta-lactamase superfamily II metal-dependent hydrolase